MWVLFSSVIYFASVGDMSYWMQNV